MVRDTKRDYAVQEFWKRVQDQMAAIALCRFMERHDVDTDAIDEDVAIFREEKMSNLVEGMGGDSERMRAFAVEWHRQHILSMAFSTGFPLFYWKWYRTATNKALSGNEWLSTIDCGGRSGADLSVYPHFKNLKEEVMATGLVGPKMFEESVVEKAEELRDSKRGRKMESNRLAKFLHFGIAFGDSVKSEHLQSMVLYSDFTKLCTLFSKSLRKNKWDDDLEDVKARNAKFYFLSRFLRELVALYGDDGRGRNKIKGPFYCGVSVVLSVSEFRIGFNTPTSTSKTREIALRFAGEGGMILTVGNQKGFSRSQSLFNVTWISSFVEEDEYFWFGSYQGVSVDDIAIVASARSYRRSLGALYLFDAALSGQDMWGRDMNGTNLKKKEIEILDFCTKHALNEKLPSKPQGVDDYVLDNLYCFQRNKTKIYLDYYYGVNRFPEFLKQLLMFGVSINYGDYIPNDRTNIFRPILFQLFPNLVEIEMRNSYHALNLLSLLSVLEESAIPQSFKVLKVKDEGRKWLKRAVEAVPEIEKQFKAKGWKLEFKTVGSGHWIFVSGAE